MEQKPNENIEQKNEPQLQMVRPYTDTDIEQYAGKVGGKRNLKEVVVTTDDNYAFHYLVKKPSRAVLQAITASEANKDTEGIQKLMIGCILLGDMDSFEFDGGIYVELLKQIGGLVKLAKGEFKNL